MADQIKTTVSAEILLPGIEKANKDLATLLRTSKGLGKDLRNEVADFASAMNNYRNGLRNGFKDADQQAEFLGKFQESLKKIKDTLRDGNLLSKGMFSNESASNVNNFVRHVESLAKAFDNLRRQESLKTGKFGLDSSSVKEAQRNLKTLDDQIKAHKFLMENSGATKGLEKQVALLERNRAAVSDVLKSLQEKAKVEELAARKSDTLNRANINAERLRESEDKRRRQERLDAAKQTYKELFNAQDKYRESMIVQRSGKDIEKTNRNWADAEPSGQQAAINRGLVHNIKLAQQASDIWLEASKNRVELNANRLNQFGGNAFFQAKMEAQQRSADEFLLNKAWRDAGGGNTKFTSNKLGDTEAIRKVTADILGLQQQLVKLSREEALTDENRKTIIDQILKKESQRTKLRQQVAHDQRMTDPEVEQRYIDYQVNKVATGGRSALLQVQAVLQANYAILNTFQQAIRSAVVNTVEFEAAMKDMQAISSSTNSEMNSLSQTVKNVSSNTKFSTVELADAGKILAQAGMSAKEIQSALPAVATLATATGSGLKETVDIVTSVVGVFDKTVTDIPDIANKISATLNLSKASAESLRLGLQYVGSTAKETHVSLEEVLASFGAMANAGIKSGSTLGTGMRQILVELQKPSQEFIDALARIGLTIADVDVKSNGWSSTLRKLSENGFVASDAIKSFDVRGASAFNSLLGNFGDIDKITKSFGDHTAAARANEAQMDSLKSQVSRLGNAFTVLTTEALGPTSAGLKSLVSGAATFITALQPFAPILAVVTTGVVGLGVAIVGSLIASTIRSLPILTSLSKSLLTVGEATKAVTFTNFAQALGYSVGSITTSMAAAGGATGLLTGALRMLWATMLANPITSVLAVLGMVTAAVLSFSSGSSTAKEKVDALSTSLNDSETSIDRSREAISKIDDAIARVSAKEELFKDNTLSTKQAQDLMADATRQVSMVLGQFGISIDANNPKLDEMKGKLIDVRREMIALQNIQMDRAIIQAQALSGAKLEEAKELAGNVSNRKINFVLNATPNAAIPSHAQEVLQQYRAFSATGKSVDQFPRLVELSNTLNSIGQNSALSDDLKKKYSDLTASLDKVAQAFIESKENNFKATNLQLKKADIQAIDGFFRGREGLLRGDTTLQESVKAEAANKGINLLENKTQYLELAFKEANKRIDALQKLKEEAVESSQSPGGITQTQLQEIRVRLEQAQKSIQASYKNNLVDTYGSNVQAQNKNDIAVLDAQIKNAVRDKKFDRSDVLAKLSEKHSIEERQLTLLEGASGSPEYKEKLRTLKMQQAEEVVTLTRQMNEVGKEASAEALRQIKEDLQFQIDTYKKRAENQFKSVNPFTTLEEIDKKVQTALEAMDEAAKVELLKFDEEQKVESKKPGYKKERAVVARADLIERQREERIGVNQRFNEPRNKAFRREVLGMRDSNEDNAASNAKEAVLNLQKFKDESAAQELQLRMAKQKAGHASEGAIENLEFERRKQEIKALQRYLDEQKSRIEELSASTSKSQSVIEKLNGDLSVMVYSEEERQRITENLTTAQEQLTKSAKNELEARKEIKKTELELAGLELIPGKSADLKELQTNLNDAWTAYSRTVDQMDVNQVIGSGMLNVARSSTATLGSALADIATKSKTTGEAFRSMSITIIKAMLDIVAQAAAMNMVKSMFGFMGIGGTSSASTPATTSGGTPMVGSFDLGSTATVAVGGLATTGAFEYSSAPKRFAGGGRVYGGVSGRDSVKALLMPGEFVVKKPVVDALGPDFFHGLNQNAGSMLQSTQSQMAIAAPNAPNAASTVNVWVVTPDQKPNSLGPKDIVAIVTDDISRGGSIKKMVKQVQVGG